MCLIYTLQTMPPLSSVLLCTSSILYRLCHHYLLSCYVLHLYSTDYATIITCLAMCFICTLQTMPPLSYFLSAVSGCLVMCRSSTLPLLCVWQWVVRSSVILLLFRSAADGSSRLPLSSVLWVVRTHSHNVREYVVSIHIPTRHHLLDGEWFIKLSSSVWRWITHLCTPMIICLAMNGSLICSHGHLSCDK